MPSHKFRRLHLNLPGLPEGSAYQPEPIFEAIPRGLVRRAPEPGVTYVALVDMSGGSDDDAGLGVAHVDADGLAVLDCLVNQGAPPPFDPRQAVVRFAAVCREYGASRVYGDAYGGQTFRRDFEREGITYEVLPGTTSQRYEALEPLLNGRRVSLLDLPLLEQQLLGLVWRAGKITHPAGEHDDWATAACAVVLAHERAQRAGQPIWWGGPLPGPAPRSVDEIQAEEDREAEERHAAGVEHMAEVLRTHGVYWPGDFGGRFR